MRSCSFLRRLKSLMNKPVNCRYFYGDYFRGKNKEECRLLAANPENPNPWKRSYCDSCPVPEILIASNSRDLALEARVVKRFLRGQVEVTFVVCTKHMVELPDPLLCPQCAAEQRQTSGGDD
jgi:hypothetical protein